MCLGSPCFVGFCVMCEVGVLETVKIGRFEGNGALGSEIVRDTV